MTSEEFKNSEDSRVFFSTNGKGRWWRTEYNRQCTESVCPFINRCQGVEGHKGVHWYYSPNGSFCWSDNANDISEDGCSGSIPPDHRSYRTPKEMTKHHFMEQRTQKEIVDPVEIARLERDETKNGESISRPVDFSKLSPDFVAELQERLKEPIANAVSDWKKKRKSWWAFWSTDKPKVS